MSEPGQTWDVRGRRFVLDAPVLMGVLNVTPDSFSDGGAYLDADAAIARARVLVADGAGIIDVGGESTRPGASRVEADEQIRRTVPVIEAIARELDVALSIDTTDATVAEAAIDAGAGIVNDVSAGQDDDRILALAAATGCGLVLMHRLKPPAHDVYSDQYESSPAYTDVVRDVADHLVARAAAARAAGVAAASIVLDPGLGFGKSVEQVFDLVRATPVLLEAGYPILSAASRKSFIGAVTEVKAPADRVIGSAALSVAHWIGGCRIFRVHDVAVHREALAVAAAVTAGPARREGSGGGGGR